MSAFDISYDDIIFNSTNLLPEQKKWKIEMIKNDAASIWNLNFAPQKEMNDEFLALD